MRKHLRDGTWKAVRGIMQRYETVHTVIGLVGNACFLAGSILFMLRMSQPASWLFITGASGMLLGAVGKAAVRVEEKREHAKER